MMSGYIVKDNNEHTENIGPGYELIVSPSHTFGTDALLLAYFASPKNNEKCCDFGTGCGIIPFYWMSRGLKEVSAVELQHLACDQLRRSIELSGLTGRFSLYEGNLVSAPQRFGKGCFSLVTMNPPYTASGKGIVSSSSADAAARHETGVTFGEICRSASELLKFGGRFCICLRPERLTEAFCTMRSAGIEPKRLRFVSKRDGCSPWLFLLEGKKGRNPGIVTEPELHIENPDGTPSDIMKTILGAYAENHERN